MKFKKITTEKVIVILYIFIFSIGVINSYNKKLKKEELVNTFYMPLSKKVILLDPGHGGWDPGKCEKDNILEKDINLSISKKLRTYLEQGGSFVLMTRFEDTALDSKKKKDMLERKNIANGSKADIFISIHQNSFPEKKVKGAQVFYYIESEKSKLLAHCIQKNLNSFLKMGNKRKIKYNKNYYILKKINITSVLVECGFLTNEKEKKLLLNENYQEKIAWAIYMGIIEYFETLEKNKSLQ